MSYPTSIGSLPQRYHLALERACGSIVGAFVLQVLKEEDFEALNHGCVSVSVEETLSVMDPLG